MVRQARAGPMSFKLTKQQYLWEGLSFFVYLFHVVTPPWKLQCYVGYDLTCPEFSETASHQYLWKLLCDFVDFLEVISSILLNIHWSYKNMLFWAGIVRHSLSANHIVRWFKIKKLRNYMRYQVNLLLLLKLQKMSCCFGLWPQNTLGWSVFSIFYFWLVWLVNLNTRAPLLHCTCCCLHCSW